MLEITTHPYKGRCFVASEPIRAGQIIMVCSPFAAVPASDCTSKVCASCLCSISDDDSVIESGSNNWSRYFYCSESCFKKDKGIRESETVLAKYLQEKHPDVHELYKNFDEYTQDYTRMLVRVLYRGQDTDFSQIWSMCSNWESFPEARIQEFSQVARILSIYYDRMGFSFLDDYEAETVFPGHASTRKHALHDRMMSLICKEECNSFGVYSFSRTGHTDERQCYGLAVYPEAVFFNHSCVPNVGHCARDSRMVFYANRDIQKGEEAMICYFQPEKVDLTDVASAEKRRRLLFDYFFFNCDCVRCERERAADWKGLESLAKVQRTCRQKSCKGWYVPQVLHMSKGKKPLINQLKMNRMDSGKSLLPQKECDWHCEACGLVI